MKTFKSILAAGAAALLTVCAAQAASAAIVNTDLGVLAVPSFTTFGNAIAVGGSSNTFQYDFETLTSAKSLFSMQDQNEGPEAIHYELLRCTAEDVGCTTVVATSANTTGATIPIGPGTLPLSAGFYRLQTLSLGLPTTLAGSINGSIKLEGSVPEPATWAMLILGIGMIGFAARRREGMEATAA